MFLGYSFFRLDSWAWLFLFCLVPFFWILVELTHSTPSKFFQIFSYSVKCHPLKSQFMYDQWKLEWIWRWKICDNSSCAGFAQCNKKLFHSFLVLAAGTAAVQSTRSERKSPSGRVQVAQREQGKRHSGILRERELREMRTLGEKDGFWCWFHWIIFQETSVSLLETAPKCKVIHSVEGKDMVSNSFCEQTVAVISHNRVQHGSSLYGCSGWDKWHFQRIQDVFPECHLTSIITTVCSPNLWPQMTIPKCKASHEEPVPHRATTSAADKHLSSALISGADIFTVPWQRCTKDFVPQCQDLPKQGPVPLEKVQIMPWLHNPMQTKITGATEGQVIPSSSSSSQNKQITSSSSIYCNISLLFLSLSHMKHLL